MRAEVLRVLMAGVILTGIGQALPASGVEPGTGVLRGTVRDVNGSALPFAHVAVTGTDLNAPTNRNGDFLIRNVPAGEHRVRVMYIGYGEQVMTVFVEAGDTTRISFALLDTGPISEPVTPSAGDDRARFDAADSTDCDSLQIVFQRTSVSKGSVLLYATPEPRTEALNRLFPETFSCVEPPGGSKRSRCEWARISPQQAKAVLDVIRREAPYPRGFEGRVFSVLLELALDGRTLTYESYLGQEEAVRIFSAVLDLTAGPASREPGGVEYALRTSEVARGALPEPRD